VGELSVYCVGAFVGQNFAGRRMARNSQPAP
jgi:hypothetical protein